MGRKGAILMLAVVAPWAAAPALACFTPVPCHSCCRAMMTDCDSAAMSDAHPCCQLQPSGTAEPQGGVVAPARPLGAVQSFVSALPSDINRPAGQILFSSKAPPPPLQSGAGTILRI
ncbi:MAG: hypothetical protein ABR956_06085 [Terracidiphilus sp.]